MQCLVSLSDGLAGYTFPLYNTLAVQKPPAGSTEPVRAPGPLDPNTLPETEPARAGLQTVRAMLNAGWPALLAALSFLLTTNLSDSIFGDVLGALQTLARAAGCLALPTPRDAFLTALAKAALPPRVVAALDEPQQSVSALRSPVSLEGLTLGLAGGGGGNAASQPPGLSPRNLACLRALVAAALSLGGTLGSSWFAVLEALQNADYVLTTRGTTSPGPAPASAAVGTSGKRSGTQTEGQVEQQQQRHQAATHPLLADVDSESVQAAIQRLFDASIMLEDGAFRDFVAALCKLSLEMVSMQSGVDVGAGAGTGEGALDVEEDNIPSASTSATSLVTPRTERFSRRRVSGIHIPRTLVRYVRLPLSTPIEKTVRTEVRRLWHCSSGGRCRAQYSTYRVSTIRRRMGCHHFTPSLCSPSPCNTAIHPPTSGPHSRRHPRNRPTPPRGGSK